MNTRRPSAPRASDSAGRLFCCGAKRRSALAISALACAFAAAGCGEGSQEIVFTACGGDITGGWTFLSASVMGSGDSCTPPASGEKSIDGFIFFNDNGRYSLNAKVKAWKKDPSDPACDFSTAFGGFYRREEPHVCFANTTSDLESIPCDGSGVIGARPLDAEAEYCASADRLRLRTSSLVHLRFEAILDLEKMP